MLHCHQFVHHPSIRPSKWSSLFGNSSHSSCVLQQLATANLNDAFGTEDSQHCNGKFHRCLSSRIRQRFQASSVANALQAYDLQEQIRKISFYDQVEFLNLFQHQQKYFPNTGNPRKRARDAGQPASHQFRQNSMLLDDVSVAQIRQMIRKTEKEKRDTMKEAERRESMDTSGMRVDYVHASLFGANYSPKIIAPADKQPRHKRSHSTPSNTSAKRSSNNASPLSNDFFEHFPTESLSLVGVGAFGRVYRIQSKESAFNDNKLAVKLIPFNSSKQSRQHENTDGGAGNKYGAPILAAAAMLAAVDEEDEQPALEGDDCSTEAQVLREVSVLSALSSPNTARYRWGWVESWSTQFEELFHARNPLKEQPLASRSNSVAASVSSFSETSSEWSSSNASAQNESNGQSPESPQESSCGRSSKPAYDSVLVLLMDYYDGIALSEFISNPSAHLPAFLSHTSVLSSLFRLYVSYQILSSLEYVHAHQCIHRDLAPKNLIVEIDRALLSSSACKGLDEQQTDALLVRLMSNQISVDEVQDSAEWNAICSIMAAFNVRLIDFGLSRHLTKESTAKEAQDVSPTSGMELSVGVGTRTYAPPEQLKRLSTCACKQSPVPGSQSPVLCEVCEFADRGDIFSCGLLMAELLCAPFQTQMERIEFLCRMRERRWAQVDSFQTLPRVLKDLLSWMLAPVASGRPSAAEAKKSKAFYAVRKLMPFIIAQRYERGTA